MTTEVVIITIQAVTLFIAIVACAILIERRLGRIEAKLDNCHHIKDASGPRRSPKYKTHHHISSY